MMSNPDATRFVPVQAVGFADVLRRAEDQAEHAKLLAKNLTCIDHMLSETRQKHEEETKKIVGRCNSLILSLTRTCLLSFFYLFVFFTLFFHFVFHHFASFLSILLFCFFVVVGGVQAQATGPEPSSTEVDECHGKDAGEYRDADAGGRGGTAAQAGGY